MNFIPMLGIDQDTSLFYEGSASCYGHAIWPSPFVSIACHIGLLADWARPSQQSTLATATMVFREDSFDPVARMRRGRLYKRRDGVNPSAWHVQQHPAYATSGHSILRNEMATPLDTYGFLPIQLLSFTPWHVPEELLAVRHNAVLTLGSGFRCTAHSVLDIEYLATGEELITVRTRASLGVMPELIQVLIPEELRDLVLEQYEKVARAAFRDDAESVIDRCREAATAALNAHLASNDSLFISGKDLSDLASRVKNRLVLSNAAHIIARLHARGKSAERIKRGNTAPSEGDAECALALLGTIYRELNWARR